MIYTGLIYQKRAPLLNGKTEIPFYFYKVILLGDSSAIIAYIAKKDSTSVRWPNYIKTVNKLEKLVWFDFYSVLS